MKMKEKKKENGKNYLDNVPEIRKKWEFLDGGIVEITVENTGAFNWIAQKLFKKPRFSFIKLDEYGSCAWRQIDGKRNIFEIGQILKEEQPKAADQLYERLSKFFGILERNGYVRFASGKGGD